MSKKVVSHSSGGQTETKTYENGRLESIQHTNDRTGENHEHEVCRGGALGALGPYAGGRK
ncbi:hypothetical protein C0584_04105 [Candidatus Parcubacteria bacterium]|nr:MAG: hypothetical protein C0584_04105 [Candidatus Parcubacteria bacterium]